MFNKKTASAGLVAIAATAGTFFTVSPAPAQVLPNAPVPAQPTAAHAPAAPAVARGDGDGDGGWWWWSSRRLPRHHRPFCGGGFCDRGFGPRHFYGGGFAGDTNRNINVLTNDINIGVQNSNTNIAVGGGY